MPSPRARGVASHSSGFTLIELVTVVAILAILAGAIVPLVSRHMAHSRDVRRLADMRAVASAIDQYFVDNGRYPEPVVSVAYDGWDVCLDGGFVDALREEGYLPEDAVDPIGDDDYHFRYYAFSKGAYGCVGETDYYVLGITGFEGEDFAAEHAGFFKCKGRDWGLDFAWVTGGGASYE